MIDSLHWWSIYINNIDLKPISQWQIEFNDKRFISWLFLCKTKYLLFACEKLFVSHDPNKQAISSFSWWIDVNNEHIFVWKKNVVIKGLSRIIDTLRGTFIAKHPILIYGLVSFQNVISLELFMEKINGNIMHKIKMWCLVCDKKRLLFCLP